MGNGFCGGRGRSSDSHRPAGLRHHCYRHANAGNGWSAVAGRSAKTVTSHLAYGTVRAIGSGDDSALGQSCPSIYFQALRRRRAEVPADPRFCTQKSAAESRLARVSDQARLPAQSAARLPPTERGVAASGALAAKDRRADWSRHGHDREDPEAGELRFLLLALRNLQRLARRPNAWPGYAADISTHGACL